MQNHSPKTQKCRKHGTKETTESTLVCGLRAEPSRQGVAWLGLAGHVCRAPETSLPCVCLRRSVAALRVWVTDKFQPVGGLADVESVRKEDGGRAVRPINKDAL